MYDLWPLIALFYGFIIFAPIIIFFKFLIKKIKQWEKVEQKKVPMSDRDFQLAMFGILCLIVLSLPKH